MPPIDRPLLRCCICAKHQFPANPGNLGLMTCPCCGYLLWWSFTESSGEYEVKVDPLEWCRDWLAPISGLARDEINYHTQLSSCPWQETLFSFSWVEPEDIQLVKSDFPTVGDLIAYLEKRCGGATHG